MTKLVLGAGAIAAWVIAVPVLALLVVLGGPAVASGAPVPSAFAATPAIATAVSMVGTPSGWYRLCDRLVCRAYGYANSGYPSAAAHWRAMLVTGNAHPGDRCPPAGAFVFWRTSSPAGHVALVTGNDRTCDPARITVVSNDVLDAALGRSGGIYHVTLARLESGFVDPGGYLGWSVPVCAGALLPDLRAAT